MNRRPFFAACFFFLITTLTVPFGANCFPLPPERNVLFLVTVGTNQLGSVEQEHRRLTQTKVVLEKRLIKSGITNALVQLVNETGLSVTLRSLKDSERAATRRLIERVSVLEFRMVHPDSEQRIALGMKE